MNISFVATVLNEENTIQLLLESLAKQTKKPNEIIIVDGGSTDKTLDLIKSSIVKIKSNNLKFKVIVKPGNRSIGRHEGIKMATGEIIAISDAGCILDKDWLKEITKPFQEKKVDVVAGYYEGLAQNIFQKCLVPYILVMPDQINPTIFLPASRSMAFKKSIWEKVNRFDQHYSLNEDFVFAKKLQKIGATIFFARKAIVYWIPPSTFAITYTMFYRFAQGDAEARIFRAKVMSIFLRYFIFAGILMLATALNSKVFLLQFIILIIIYIVWSIQKNYVLNKQKTYKNILNFTKWILRNYLFCLSLFKQKRWSKRNKNKR
jgi:cellulose synthase/poly-beta-1,6-N-acetylglucosamine synthase-like glycosyltransferase